MFRIPIVPFLPVLLSALLAAPAQAAVSRTYVASYGDDANTAYSCDFAHPCRTFQTAFSQVTTGGEILAVDGSGYGTLVIDRSVAVIANPGIFAGIGVFSGSGVTIATAGVNVTLRGLTLNGQGGSYGVNMTNGSRLSVENCVIANFSTSGQHGVAVSTAATVRIVDSLFRNNDTGIKVSGGAVASISGSQFLGNANIGIYVTDNSVNTASAAISRSVVSGSYYGIAFSNWLGSSSAVLTLSSSTVTGNQIGLYQAAAGGGTAVFEVLGNNAVRQNGTPTTGTITSFSTL